MCSTAVERRGGSASPFSCRASTPAPESSEDADPRTARTSRTSFRYPRHQRLTRGPEIRAVAQEGKRIRTTHLEVRALASPLGVPRVGLIVPRHQQTAVDRNRLKRRIRELVRTRVLPARVPADVLFRARREAYQATFAMLEADVERAVAQLDRIFRAERT